MQFKLDGITIHKDTISKWSDHYSGIIGWYSAALRVDAGHRRHADEMLFGVRGATRYLFAVMNGASRFILSYEASPLKHGADPSGLFARAAERSLRLPRVLVSDGLHEFRAAARKVFYRAAGPGSSTAGRYTYRTCSARTTCTNASTASSRTGCGARAA